MLQVTDNMKNIVTQAMETKGFNQKYSVERLILNNRLYSVYLLSETEKSRDRNAVLLIEHPPATEPAAHLLPIQIRHSASKKETIQVIIDAVEEHFAQKEDASS